MYALQKSPYGFGGMGEKGLEILAQVSEQMGLPTISEVMDPSHVEIASGYADILSVGAENMHNYALLDAVGTGDRPVLIKRDGSATDEELLLAAEQVIARGNHRVILCERGIRTFEGHARAVMDIASIPAVHRLSHLPVIADPVESAGRPDFALAMARAAIAAGANGLVIDVHDDDTQRLRCKRY